MENKTMAKKCIRNNIYMFLKLYIYDMKEKLLLIFGTTMLCLFFASHTIVEEFIDYYFGNENVKNNNDSLWMYIILVIVLMVGLLELKVLDDIKKKRNGADNKTRINILKITTVVTGIIFVVVTVALVASIINAEDIQNTIKEIEPWKPRGTEGSIYTFIVAVILSFTTLKDLGYLHEKRKSDLYESMPISRRVLLFEKIMIGYSKTIIPVILSTIAAVIFCISNGTNPIEICWFGVCSCVFLLFNIAFGSCICVCCGRKMESVITYIVINVLIVSLLNVVSIVLKIAPGEIVIFEPEYVSRFVSPLFMIFAEVLGGGYYEMLYESKMLVFTMLLASAAVFAIEFFIIKYRKAESAEDKCGFIKLYTVIKYCAAVIVGTLAGLALAYVKANSNLLIQLLVFWTAAVVAVVLAYIILHIVYHREIKNIVKEAKGIVVSLITIAIIMFTAQTGMFGLDSYQPELDDIEYIEVSTYQFDSMVGDYTYYPKKVYSEVNKKILLNIHQEIIKDYSEAKEFGLNKIYLNKSDNYDDIRLVYKLKNGKTIERYYSGYDLDDKVLNQVKEISTAEELAALDLSKNRISEINVENYNKGADYYLKLSNDCMNDIKEFRDVYIKEAKEKTEGDGKNKEDVSDINEKKFYITFYLREIVDNQGNKVVDDYYSELVVEVTEDMKESYKMIKKIVDDYGEYY